MSVEGAVWFFDIYLRDVSSKLIGEAKRKREQAQMAIFLKGRIKKIPSICYPISGQYIVGTEFDFPWIYLPETLHTFLDHVPSFIDKPQSPGPYQELFNVLFFWISNDLGLILQPHLQSDL